MNRFDDDGDPVPLGLVLSLDEAFGVLEALEDGLAALERAGLAPGLADEMATEIRIVHSKLGLDEGRPGHDTVPGTAPGGGGPAAGPAYPGHYPGDV